MSQSPGLEVSQFLLEELQVSAALPHLTVEPRSHIIIVSLLAHGVGSVDEGLFALDLLVQIRHGVVFGTHDGGWVCVAAHRTKL